jgi:hypothetical protein
MTSLTDLIFPGGDPRDGYILRLDLVGSWESQFLGLGRLTAFLTPRLLDEAHAVDDMGINVVFLQRHRVEIGLKLILERARATPVGDHRIDLLWNRCAQACMAAGFSSQWQALISAQKDFAFLLNRVDPDAATFRYPVDRRNQPWERGKVDLAELERTGAEFQQEILILIRELATAEPLPVTAEEADQAVDELQSLIDGCRRMIRTNRAIMDDFRQQADALEALGPTRRQSHADARRDSYAALAAIAEVTEPLAARAQDLLDRIVAAYGIERAVAPPPPPIEPAPVFSLFSSAKQMKATQDAQIKWLIDHLVREIRPLIRAVNAVLSRSEAWSTPAARQIHLDVTRFGSRLGGLGAEPQQP